MYLKNLEVANAIVRHLQAENEYANVLHKFEFILI